MENRNILVVDDESELTELICLQLRAEGWTVEPAMNGLEALAKLKLFDFDLILSDIRMPGLSGTAFMNGVRLSGSNIPCIFLTASHDVKHLKEAVRLGAFDYIEKPVEHEELIKVVGRALAFSHANKKITQRIAEPKKNRGDGPGDTELLPQMRAKNNMKR